MGILHTFDGEKIPPSHFLDFEVLNDRKIDGVAGIETVDRVEGMIRREGLRGIQRSVRRILTGRIEFGNGQCPRLLPLTARVSEPSPT